MEANSLNDLFSIKTALFLSFIAFFYLYLDGRTKYWKRKGVNGPEPLPLIGDLLDNIFTPQNILEERRYLRYGNIYGTMMAMKPVLNIGDPEIIKQLFITDFRCFKKSPRNHADLILNKMLVESNGNEWKRLRTILSTTFTSAKLKVMQLSIVKCIRNSCLYLDNVSKQNLEIEVRKLVMAFTMDAVAKCIFGVETDALKNPEDEFVVRGMKLVQVKVWRLLCRLIFPFGLQYKFDMGLVADIHTTYFINLVRNIIEKRRETKSNQNDFVTLLLNAEYKGNKIDDVILEPKQKTLTEDEIIAQCFLFFAAGYETTATFLQNATYALSVNQEVQEKLFQELNNHFQQQKEVNFESLNSLPYFEAVFCETLRLYTPVTVFEQICTEDYSLESKGFTIDKGTTISLSFCAMHHDPKLFPNPHEFKPEPFLPENRDKIVPYSFLPFGTGPRMCIGNRFSKMQSKLFLAHLVYNYQLLKTKKTPKSPEFNGAFIFLHCKLLYITVKRRGTISR